MSSDWVPAAFALGGSGLTGVLTLAGQHSQRWQAERQIAEAERVRREETRRSAYTDFLTTATVYRTASWVLLDLNDQGRPAEDLLAARDDVLRAWREFLRALAAARLVGPESILGNIQAAGEALTALDSASDSHFQEPISGTTLPEVDAAMIEVSERLREFAEAARIALGFDQAA